MATVLGSAGCRALWGTILLSSILVSLHSRWKHTLLCLVLRVSLVGVYDSDVPCAFQAMQALLALPYTDHLTHEHQLGHREAMPA